MNCEKPNRKRAALGTLFLVPFIAVMASTQTAQSNQIVLITLDEKVQLRGELVGVEGASYVLVNASGTYTVDASLVECHGYSCPLSATATSELKKNPLNNLEYASVQELIENSAN